MSAHSDLQQSRTFDFSLLFDAINSDESSVSAEIIVELESQADALRQIEELLQPTTDNTEVLGTFLSN